MMIVVITVRTKTKKMKTSKLMTKLHSERRRQKPMFASHRTATKIRKKTKMSLMTKMVLNLSKRPTR